MKQFHATETTKYAHVTFFFNGGIEEAYQGEERKLVDTINVKNFADYPRMKAQEITENAVEAIEKYGIFKGGYLALRRLLRCHPFYKGDIFDPVP